MPGAGLLVQLHRVALGLAAHGLCTGAAQGGPVRGGVQSAQQYALNRNNQQFTPEHILKVLLDDPEGLAAGLIDRAGGRSRDALQQVELALSKLPKVQGAGAGQLYLSPPTAVPP